ncbi:hypothetical protein QTP70_021182 [Hemibagrus guttatus]|uniref:Rab11 family-interacting protein 5 n=1 Tax=Hemibagrus guttatus TaxID=175788 RepID=A0AAE0QYT5_9TELE|nr:hypothetical protein QTP70_021182 [Hemibagrus guttatus]
MPLISLDDEDQRWVPTHVNVTVLRARALRTKGKQGSRYVYTVIQLGKLKYTTGLTEKAAEPEWNEECSLELQPGLLECAGAHPPGSGDLILTVMLRVLIGLDVFLGEAVVPLDKVFQSGTCPRNEWLKLNSKAGRKEKERGELQLTIQFTRNNMTASMYDLTIQDKPRSAFGKLKDRVTGKKRGDVESSSAILPGRYAALSGSTSQSFQEDGGQENPVQDEGTDEGKSKVKGFFLKGKLRKNSDTRSCSSLASESSMASSAGDPFVPIELCSTPVYSSRVVEPFRTDSDGGVKVFTAPKVMTHKRAHSDEASKITVAARPNMAVESVKGQNTLLSKSTLCINGSHVYSEPIYSKGPGSLPIKRTLLDKCSPLSRSLQNLTRRSEDTQRRSSIDKSKKELEGDAEGSSALTVGVTISEGKPVNATAALVTASSTTDVADKGKKLRKTLFSSGRSDSLPAKPEQGQEGRLRGWFGSTDTQNKPSSASDVNQTTFGIVNKDNNKAPSQCPDATDFDSSGILSICGFSSVPPQDLLNRMGELEPFSPKETPGTVVVTSGLSDNNHSEKPCDSVEQHSVQPHSDIMVRFEPEDSNHKESSVSPQTIPQQDRDDRSVTAQLKPEATEDNAGLDTPHEVGCCLIYDKIKTKTAELEPEANSFSVPVSESHKISESPLTLTDAISFEDLHARVAPRGSRSPSKTEVRSARIRTHSTSSSPKMSLHKSPSPSFSHPNTTSDPSLCPTTRPGLGSTLTEAPYTTSTLQRQATAKHTEAEPASSHPPAEESSPHPVKPLTSTAISGEKKSVLEKLRSSIHPGRSTQQNMAEPEKPPVWMSEAHTHFQTLSNMELIALLLQQEMDAERQRAESELQATLLEKREAELKKLKVQVRDLEDYIDKLLVRIMEQTPTLLQIRARPK